MKRKLILIMVIMAGLLVACDDNNNDANDDLQPANEVWMTDSAFMPAELFITAGSMVRWVNNSNVTHTVTSSAGMFDQYLDPGGSFSHVFTEPGTFLYVCTLHPGMTGTVTVE